MNVYEIDLHTGCHLWQGDKTVLGYARKRIGGRKGKYVYLHRLKWEEANGPIPKGMVICHSCDRPSCLNIAHLFLGTQGDNMRDMTRKGRHGKTWRKGSDCPWSKVDEAKVREIRAMREAGASLNDIAAKFGIYFSTVSKIAARKTWRHVV